MKLPMQAAGRRSKFFEQEAVDHLVTMMIELSSELWTTRERLFALESVLSRQNPDLIAAIEAWEAREDEQARLEAMRQRMLGEIFRSLGIERPGPSDEAVVAMAS